jgi:hypothetical protein
MGRDQTILNLTCILRCYSASFLQNKRSTIQESKQKTCNLGAQLDHLLAHGLRLLAASSVTCDGSNSSPANRELPSPVAGSATGCYHMSQSHWASLHADLVLLISSRVLAEDLLDYVRFWAVRHRLPTRPWHHRPSLPPKSVDDNARGARTSSNALSASSMSSNKIHVE